jgi:hypothetical protein
MNKDEKFFQIMFCDKYGNDLYFITDRQDNPRRFKTIGEFQQYLRSTSQSPYPYKVVLFQAVWTSKLLILGEEDGEEIN